MVQDYQSYSGAGRGPKSLERKYQARNGGEVEGETTFQGVKEHQESKCRQCRFSTWASLFSSGSLGPHCKPPAPIPLLFRSRLLCPHSQRAPSRKRDEMLLETHPVHTAFMSPPATRFSSLRSSSSVNGIHIRSKCQYCHFGHVRNTDRAEWCMI